MATGYRLLGVPKLLRGRARHAPGPRYVAVRSIFFAGLGLVFFAAFTSLRAQARGLYGRRGILPIADTLDRYRLLPSATERWSYAPTLFWLDDSDEAIDRVCARGQVLGVALFFGVAPRWTSLLLWAHYLSFVAVGGEFLGFQWDALLLEAGLHAAIVAPPENRRRAARSGPTWIEVAMMRWLVLRLHFESGVIKYRSPDRCWRDRTALDHYYETAPLPTPIGWYAHQLPERFQSFSTLATIGIECGAPVVALAGRVGRVASFGLTTFLQSLIALTGNYGFFNALTLLLGLWLLDDRAIARVTSLGPADASWPRTRPRRAWSASLSKLAAPLGFATIGAVSSTNLLMLFESRRLVPTLLRLEPLRRRLAPFRSISPYGPFSVMTRDRPEIVIEGSDDGVRWAEYSFRYKIGDPMRAPRWVAPHQPRLDWQMWFAALRSRPPRWFAYLMQRLLEASPEVLALFESAPFGAQRPRLLRASLYTYEMTSFAERRRTGAWWRRERLGLYFPPVSLG